MGEGPMISRDEFQKRIGVGRSAFYDHRKKDPDFPAPFAFSRKAVRYRAAEVEEYIERRRLRK
jgi:predicted DNA-binding transcriptional regulator AlpA